MAQSQYRGSMTDEAEAERGDRTDGTGWDAVRDEGGESACQLHRVCAECGRMNERPRAGRCEACGADLTEV